MNATDLMIGDWVKCTDPRCEGHQVDLIDNGNEEVGLDGEIDNFENIIPIPLTPEILEKNVTHYIEREYMNFFPIGNKDAATIIMYKRKSEQFVLLDKSLTEVCEIKYVHELQHALRLLGIEKEVLL